MSSQTAQRRIEVLLAEDNPADVRLTRDALKDSLVARINLSVTTNGEDTLAYIRRQGKYAAAIRPDLILLDLNLPKKDGREVLTEMRKDSDLDCIPVIIMTTSRAEQDIVRCYKLHANGYVTKPDDADQFGEIMKCIEGFWIQVAQLPPHCGKQ